MKVFEVTASNGRTGRCDARCYNAYGKVCVCACGGKNHGVGADHAQGGLVEEARIRWEARQTGQKELGFER